MSELLAAEADRDVRAYLHGLSMHGIKLGLQNITHLLRCAGNPHDTYPTVHVAGTNGKGSVLAFLQAMLMAAGYRVGRFTSPHLIDVTERFQIDGVSMSEAALTENIGFFRRAAEGMEYPPTFFEINTAVAFRYFAQAGVDIALIEVGMGGRLDSTNVILPRACAITTIDLEHTQYLGDTLAKIAYEKSGILKTRVPVVVGETRPEPRDVILRHAEELDSPVRLLNRDFRYAVKGPAWGQSLQYESRELRFEGAPLALAGAYQGQNAAVACALAEALRTDFPKLDAASVRAGLGAARWPGRMERVLESPPVIIDVAHNTAGARRIAESVDACVTVFAVSSDKDAAGMLRVLAPHSPVLILTEYHGRRSLGVEALAAAAGDLSFRIAPSLEAAIAMGMAAATPERPLLITGSIYAAGEARQILMRDYGAPPPAF